MKIERLKVGAVIPVQQYGNIQPEIELTGIDSLEDAKEYGIGFVRELFTRYSEKGSLPEKLPINATTTEKSYNEDIEINYDPIAHEYYYKDKKLRSVTDYISDFYQKFDEETASSVSSSSWGVDQDSIKSMWKMNGNIASTFGTAIHDALDYYEKYGDVGKKISEARGSEENYAMPKHPLLKKIVQEFIKINKYKNKSVETEVILSSSEDGLCGRSDRLLILDKKKKTCRVQDYKINIGSEEEARQYKIKDERFKDLPSNKISKYQLQLSVYANMLQKSGWNVEGLDVYVYEDNWKHFELEVLDVI